MSTGSNDLQAFQQFLADQLHSSTTPLTPEQCLKMWRTQHPKDQELKESTVAVKQAIAEMEAGDTGRSARELIEEARKSL